MSKMMLRSSKPPLPRSPIRLRSRRALRSTTNTLQTPPGSLTKSQLPNPRSDVEEWEMRPEYHTISCELRALAKMVQQEIGNGDGGNPGNEEYSLNPRSPLFERGRLYEEYSARRNERLKRKKCGEEKAAVYGLGVRVESAKKRVVQSGRKIVPATPMTAQRGGEKPRYMLRSMTTSKENKKPPHLAMSVEKSVGGGEKKKTAVRRSRKI
ncbi:uncharacterized protein LOC116007246 [Ipomoea triloba]|uniref:uncharacterized protein LOC116007246 n=1 Tax=Ipomoea triloba TaxID=35885 RepID=UPI00125D768E|nr:uncharacterized protein LOC116007246 [Ipomoea triloba]